LEKDTRVAFLVPVEICLKANELTIKRMAYLVFGAVEVDSKETVS
jgi:hypothetical protein